jgi:hypothetical protein
LRASLAPEVTSKIFRYVLDERLLVEFIVQEFPSGDRSQPARWLRSLEEAPPELIVDG